MSHELTTSVENSVAIMLPGRAGAVEADFNVFNTRFVSGTLTATNINADTTITEDANAAGLFHISWSPTAEQYGGTLTLKHVASGDSAAESIIISKRTTRIKNIEIGAYPSKRSSDGTNHLLYDPDNAATLSATYTRTTAGSTEIFTR